LALTPTEAAEALDCNREIFDKHTLKSVYAANDFCAKVAAAAEYA
jgi:hypothetical protein